VFQQPAQVSSTSYSVTVSAHLGSKVDFALDPGAGSDDLCDDAIFTATIRTSDPTITVVADSAADWSLNGVQGEKHWFYGYFNGGSNAVAPVYRARDFIPYPRGTGPFGAKNFWDGDSWNWWNGDPPNDEIGQFIMNPNGINAGEQHWVIRRWVSTVEGELLVDWTLLKLEASGAGVTGRVFHNGTQRDVIALPGRARPRFIAA